MIAEEDEPKLLTWIIIQLNGINQSNATGLAKYIITLIKQNFGDIQELKTYYIEQLKSFLKDKTAVFVNILIDGLKEKKYQTVVLHRDNYGDEDEVDYDENYEDLIEEDNDDDMNRRGRISNSNNYKSNYTEVHNNNEDDIHDDDDDESSHRNRHRTSYGSNDGDNKHTHSDNTNKYDNHSAYNQTNKAKNIDKSNKNTKYQKHTGNTLTSNMGYASQSSMDYGNFGSNNSSASIYPPPYSTMINNPNTSISGSMNLTESMPSFTNAYQQAVAAALHIPYNPISIPNFYNPVGHNMNNSNISMNHLSDTTTNVPMSQNAGRISYEDELIAQHIPAAPTTGINKPPPPSGPAPRTQLVPQNNNIHVDTNSTNTFVYGANIIPCQNSFGISPTATAPIKKMQSSYSNRDNNANIVIGKEKKFNMKNSQFLPENERCTLKCSGIPSYVTEADIRNHFEAFGHIVELQIIFQSNEEKSTDVNNTDGLQPQQQNEKKKVYNECLVQFYHSANAKKCLTSPLPVLNNRFIHLHASSFNITPIADVEIPSQDIIDYDFQLLTESMITPKSTTMNTIISSSNINRKKSIPSFNMYTSGMSNKYRRISDEHDLQGSVMKVSITNKQDENEIENKDEEDMITAAITNIESNNIDTLTTKVTTGKGIIPSIATIAQNKEKQALIEKHEKLKILRQQAEEILKKKENILQEQLDKCRQMIDKLETSVDTDSKQTLLQSLEAKVLTFQTQLRSLREQVLDKRNTTEPTSNIDITSPIYNKTSSYVRNIPTGYIPGGRISHHQRGGRGGRYSNIPMNRGGRFNGRMGGRISNTVYIRSQSEDDTDININETSNQISMEQVEQHVDMIYNQVINTDVVLET